MDEADNDYLDWCHERIIPDGKSETKYQYIRTEIWNRYYRFLTYSVDYEHLIRKYYKKVPFAEIPNLIIAELEFNDNLKELLNE